MQTIQTYVSRGYINDKSNVYSTLLKHSFSVERYHTGILGDERLVSLASPEAATMLAQLPYAHQAGTAEGVKTTTLLVVGDFDTTQLLQTLHSALQYLDAEGKATGGARVAAVHTGAPGGVGARLVSAWSQAYALSLPRVNVDYPAPLGNATDPSPCTLCTGTEGATVCACCH